MEGGGGCRGDLEKPESSRRERPVSPSFCLFSSVAHTEYTCAACTQHTRANVHMHAHTGKHCNVFLSRAIFIHSSSLPLSVQSFLPLLCSE